MLSERFNNYLLSEKFYTEKEIFNQPETWIKVWENFKKNKSELRKFFENIIVKEKNDFSIILTGAGTSAYIGDVLLGIFSLNFNNPISAVATTDIITHPEFYFNHKKKYLLISFARSGNSPESSQAINLAEKFAEKIYHLIITCSENSSLVQTVADKKHFNLFMPAEAEDKGLAMTSSFTSMLLTGLLISKIYKDENLDIQMDLIYKYAKRIISFYSKELRKVSSLDFKRAVFLGSGMLKGVARESHLKLQELTDGRVICKYDSFLGFRHGPKAVIDDTSLVVYLFSNNAYVNLYEMDLAKDLISTGKNLYSIGVMEQELDIDTDLKIILSDNSYKIQEEFLPLVSIIPAQLLGYYKSLSLGLNPDSPSRSGMIHRVVQGVRIYPYIEKTENIDDNRK
jgi:tagatose-6-phosphate ketose/aldose isomerase